MDAKRKTGTKEWSESSVNCCLGCSHACLYCYGRSQAIRFERIPNGADWTNERINTKAVEKGYGKRRGVVMFPTTHDITEGTGPACITVLRKLLAAGNRVLIVSKPHPSIFQHVREQLAQWKDQVLFRFSIGTLNEEVARFWEPGAPTPRERETALAAAFVGNWQTSVSMEPLLTPWDVGRMIEVVSPYVTDTIWIGTLNKMHQRCEWAVQTLAFAARDVARLEAWQSDHTILSIYHDHKVNPLIRWKDSYKAVLRKYGIEVSQ